MLMVFPFRGFWNVPAGDAELERIQITEFLVPLIRLAERGTDLCMSLLTSLTGLGSTGQSRCINGVKRTIWTRIVKAESDMISFVLSQTHGNF